MVDQVIEPSEEQDEVVLDIVYPKISSDLYEQNLRRNPQEEGLPKNITPEMMLAIDTAFALKEKNPSLFGKDEDPYKSIALGQSKLTPAEDQGVQLTDAEILRRYLRNPENKPMREGSFAKGFKKEIAPQAGGLAGFITGAKIGYALQKPIPAVNPFAIGAKFLIPVATGIGGQILGEEGIEEIRDRFFGEPDLVAPGEGARMERVGETAAIGAAFLPFPFLTTKKALDFGAGKYLENLLELKNIKLEKAFEAGPLPKRAAKAAIKKATAKGPRTTRLISSAERNIPRIGQRAAEKPGRTLLEEAGFAGGATGARYFSEEYMDGEYAPLAEIAGGIAVGLAGPAVIGLPYTAIKNREAIYDGLKKIKDAFTPGSNVGVADLFKRKGDNQALVDVVNIIEERLQQAGEDPEKVAQILEDLTSNSQFREFTSGTLSQSPTLLRIEDEMAGIFPELKEQGKQGLRSAIDSYKNLIAAFAMVGDAGALRQVEGAFQDTLEQAFTQKLSQQAQKVLEAANRIGTGETEEAVGRALQENLSQALTAARAKERFLYNQIPNTEISVFRAFPEEGEEVGEIREIPNLFDWVDLLPESRAELKALPRPLQTSIDFIKEVLEDSGIDTSRLGKRGPSAGITESSQETARIEARIERLAQQRQSILDRMPQRTVNGMRNLLDLGSNSPRFSSLPVEEQVMSVRSDLRTIDDLIEATRGRRNIPEDQFRMEELKQIRQLLNNRLSSARAQDDLANVGARVVERTAEDQLADTIVDLRILVDELRQAGEPIVISSNKLSGIRSRALASGRELEANAKYNDARLSNRFAELVDQDLTGAVGDIGGDRADTIRAALTMARAYSSALNDVFTRASAPAAVLGTRTTGADRLSPEESIRSLFTGRSDRVYRNAKEIARVGQFLRDEVNPDIELIEDLPGYIDVGRIVGDVPDVLERALRNIRSTALRPREGEEVGELSLNIPELTRWLEDPTNQQLLAIFPRQLEMDLRDADAAYELLMTARKQADQSAKEARERLSFKRLIDKGDETPTAVIRGALSSQRPLFELNQILTTINRSDVDSKIREEARESLKSGVFDWAITRSSNRDGDLNPTRMYDSLFAPTSSGSQVTPADWLISKNLLSKTEAETIQRYLAEMRNLESLTAKGGLDDLIKQEGPLRDLALRIIGAKLGTTASSIVGGSEASLIAAAAGSRALRALFVSKSGINNMKAFKMLLQDPETLARLLKTPRNRREAKNLYQLAKDWAMSKGFVFSRRAYVAGQEPGEDGFEAQEAEQPQESPFVLTPEEQALSEQEARRLLEEDRRMAAPRPTAQVSMPPVSMPTPQAAPAPAAPAPQQRAQYAALFPEDPISGLIQSGGIASLAS
jgi:hypothetical protein